MLRSRALRLATGRAATRARTNGRGGVESSRCRRASAWAQTAAARRAHASATTTTATNGGGGCGGGVGISA
eukprot:6184588-Pleurochrysis_carterae.AAC.3